MMIYDECQWDDLLLRLRHLSSCEAVHPESKVGYITNEVEARVDVAVAAFKIATALKEKAQASRDAREQALICQAHAAVVAAVAPLFDAHGPVTHSSEWQDAWRKAETAIKAAEGMKR